MFWYASFELGDRELRIDRRRGDTRIRPDRRIKLSSENVELLPEFVFRSHHDEESNTDHSHHHMHSSCCAICISDFSSGEVLKVLQPCQHEFHKQCIVPWLTEYKACCPVCQTDVKLR
mmetsp:Transcript_20883/g.45223  ORF Transcript_20883/g.45223 Transcript_20883/m.45223 type:complete len:118 (-) Transcript_20883:144-497(-)|eukprot:scaffold6614_cov230-Alexandrium_tamarense.AAC.2